MLDGQRSLYSEELTLAEARGSEYQSLVQLYRHSAGAGNENVFQVTLPLIYQAERLAACEGAIVRRIVAVSPSTYQLDL